MDAYSHMIVDWAVGPTLDIVYQELERIILQIPDTREYISVKEAVAIFGVERDTIYRLINLSSG